MIIEEIRQTLINHSVLINYRFIDRYMKFINHCKSINFVGYTERHHIIPRSFKGSNHSNNLICLSARCHYIAHLLLAKATGSPKMIKALHKMVYSKNNGRDYRITSRIYEYLRIENSKIVSNYSKNTVVARQIYTEEVRRIPKKLFEKYNGILYDAISKGRKDSDETRSKKLIASKKPRKVKQGLRSRKLAASIYSYHTPKGYCECSSDLLNLYPSFTKNTLTMIDNTVIITSKFASIHKEFIPYIGKTFEQYGIYKNKRK